ncbi:hypothetical protein RJ640_003944 [Escallonia rubra]|uniref:Probable zinc-ribbon domain-containing protein n=1 Tax=Escallonia rubra TaxID=112253 RepID=A0AA88RNN8_9ASTE|nr:hypothetical protein RJ640_003944 [Escallonia rubra]
MSDEERVLRVSEKPSEKVEKFDFSGKRLMNLSDGSDNVVKSNGGSISKFEEEVLLDVAGKYRNESTNKANKLVIQNDSSMNADGDELGHTKMRKEFQDLKPETGTESGSRRSWRAMDWGSGERGETERLRSTQIGFEGVRYSTSKYLEEGPSNYRPQSGYGYAEPLENGYHVDGFNKVENFGHDRLRKLEEWNQVRLSGSSTSRAEEVLEGKAAKYWNGNLKVNGDIDELDDAKLAKELEYLNIQKQSANGSRRSGQILDWKSGEGGDMEGFRTTQKVDAEGLRYATSKYSEEGPLNSQMGSTYGYPEPVKNRSFPDGFNNVEYLEQDRAELLRKLDELKDQISRSRDVIDKPKQNVPIDRRVVHHDPYSGSENWFPEGSLGLSRASMQHSMPDNHLGRPPYDGHYAEPSPLVSRHETAMHNYHPSLHTPNQAQGFGDPFRSQMLRRAPNGVPGSFQLQPPHQYFPGQYMDNDMATMNPSGPYQHDINLHHPSCPCFHCYNKHQVPPPVPPNAFHDRRFSEVPNKQMFYRHENPAVINPPNYAPRYGNPPVNSHNPPTHTRWSSDLSSEAGGFVRRRPARVLLATSGRRCHPIAGGAPFLTCCNCFELLQLPMKVLPMEKGEKKMRCAACSSIILVTLANKKLVLSVPAEAKETPANIGEEDEGSSQGHANWASVDFSADDYDNSGYDFQSLDQKLVSTSTGQDLGSNKSTGTRSLHSTSSFTSEHEDSPGSLLPTSEEANSAELPAEVIPPRPPSGSPLQDHIDYSNKYNVVNRLGKGSRSGRSEQEKVMPNFTTTRQTSMKDAGQATEMEISSNEYSNTGTSLDSGDASREEYQLRVNRGGESFLAGILKRGFRDLSRSNTVEQGRTSVTVNGHPIADRLVKKAEKLAGPIQPGQYWYDSRAGFWGAIGGPCLGIIPPFIEEFNYPMPVNCAGGNTGVLVNGRELHQKDLNLLGSRGLPTDRDRSYIVEISGRVLDEDSSEELDSLGKLAPTVERAKRGFGMKVSRAAA